MYEYDESSNTNFTEISRDESCPVRIEPQRDTWPAEFNGLGEKGAFPYQRDDKQPHVWLREFDAKSQDLKDFYVVPELTHVEVDRELRNVRNDGASPAHIKDLVEGVPWKSNTERFLQCEELDRLPNGDIEATFDDIQIRAGLRGAKLTQLIFECKLLKMLSYNGKFHPDTDKQVHVLRTTIDYRGY